MIWLAIQWLMRPRSALRIATICGLALLRRSTRSGGGSSGHTINPSRVGLRVTWKPMAAAWARISAAVISRNPLVLYATLASVTCLRPELRLVLVNSQIHSINPVVESRGRLSMNPRSTLGTVSRPQNHAHQ